MVGGGEGTVAQHAIEAPPFGLPCNGRRDRRRSIASDCSRSGWSAKLRPRGPRALASSSRMVTMKTPSPPAIFRPLCVRHFQRRRNGLAGALSYEGSDNAFAK